MAEQLNLLGEGLAVPPPAAGPIGAARASDPATSKAAARANRIARGKTHHQVLWVLHLAGSQRELERGLTDYELAWCLQREGLRGSVAKRRQELCWPHRQPPLVAIAVTKDGHTWVRPTDTGSPAIVHRLTALGHQTVADFGCPFDFTTHDVAVARLGQLVARYA